MKIKILLAIANMQFVTVTFGLSGTRRFGQYFVLILSIACVAIGASLFREGLKIGGVPPPLGYLGGGAALIAVALTVFVNSYSIIDIVAMNDEFVWLRGAKLPFLESLPRFAASERPNQAP